MGSTSNTEEDQEDDPAVPAGVLEGIEDVLAGRAADEEDLDEALDS